MTMLKRTGTKSMKLALPTKTTIKKTNGANKPTLPSDEYKDEIKPVEVSLTNSTKLVISVKRNQEDGLPRLDIREFITSEKYTGFTKKGVNISLEKISPLLDVLSAVETDDKIAKMIADLKAVEDEEVARDWQTLLSKKSVGKISAEINYSMNRKDIEELADLYQSGKYQDKILEVLEDINYHREYGFFSEEDFDGLYDYLDEEWD